MGKRAKPTWIVVDTGAPETVPTVYERTASAAIGTIVGRQIMKCGALGSIKLYDVDPRTVKIAVATRVFNVITGKPVSARKPGVSTKAEASESVVRVTLAEFIRRTPDMRVEVDFILDTTLEDNHPETVLSIIAGKLLQGDAMTDADVDQARSAIRAIERRGK